MCGRTCARPVCRVQHRERAIARGLPDHDADVATLVVAALEGAILLARADADPTVLERAGRTLARLVQR